MKKRLVPSKYELFSILKRGAETRKLFLRRPEVLFVGTCFTTLAFGESKPRKDFLGFVNLSAHQKSFQVQLKIDEREKIAQ